MVTTDDEDQHKNDVFVSRCDMLWYLDYTLVFWCICKESKHIKNTNAYRYCNKHVHYLYLNIDIRTFSCPFIYCIEIKPIDCWLQDLACGICNEMLAMISYHASNLIVGIPFIALKTCWESCFFEASVNNPSIPTQKLRWYQLTRIASKIRSRLQSR